jgi:hypothetical protein
LNQTASYDVASTIHQSVFDGSFPVDAVDFIHPYMMKGTVDVLLVATKVDLLPTQCTRNRVAQFVRRRAKTFGRGFHSSPRPLLSSS